MPNRLKTLLAILLPIVATTSAPLSAGGAWVPEPGHGDVHLGFSRKTADTSWNAFGEKIEHAGRFENHDFRYTYLAGEIGLRRHLSATFVLTWLDGREGPDGDLHRNAGWSDAWVGLKYGWGDPQRPMAVRLEVRTPALYDISGPYSLELYDDAGNFLGNSPEWRGLLKHDVSLTWLHSRSLGDGGWVNVETGYTWCEGAPADRVPLDVDAGWPLSWGGLVLKGSVAYRQSLGNDSPRRDDDRFGSRPGYNFNDASMARGSLSFLLPVGRDRRWLAEAGYNVWLWGRSARQYEEPFVAMSRRF